MTTMKRIVVKLCGSDREPFDVNLQPGTTAREVLAGIGLDARMRLTDPSGSLVWEGDDDLGSQVEDGQKLYAILLTYAC
jgi:hypothetical protein